MTSKRHPKILVTSF